MSTTTNSIIIALFDGVGELIAPTANFTPASGFPLSNLTNSQLFSRCRTTDLATDRQLTWDLGAATEFSVFALFGCNASLSTTRRFITASDSGFTANIVQSGSGLDAAFDNSLAASGVISIRTPHVQPWGRSLIYVLSESVSRRYIRWHQSDATNSDGYQEWGIARVGLAWQPITGFDSWRAVPRLVGPIGAEKTLRGHEITFSNLSRVEAYDLQGLALTSLSSRRMLVIPEALSPATFLADALWCVLEGAYVREPRTFMSYADKKYKVVLTFREVDR